MPRLRGGRRRRQSAHCWAPASNSSGQKVVIASTAKFPKKRPWPAGAEAAELPLLFEGARFAARLNVRCRTAADLAELATPNPVRRARKKKARSAVHRPAV